MLKAAGIPLYQRLNVHGYWSLGGGKMSKSVGNVVEAFPLTDKYGHDAFRYFLLREMNFGLDASFSEEAFVRWLNADLANDLGNLASRATTMIVNFGGPVRGARAGAGGARGPAVRDAASSARSPRRARRWRSSPSSARSPRSGSFIGGGEPLRRHHARRGRWRRIPRQAASASRRVLYTLAEALRVLGIVLDPFLPDAAAKIRGAVGAPAPSLADLGWGRLAPGTPVTKLSGLFPRIDVGATRGRPVPGRRRPRPKAEAGLAKIPIDEFAKVELRVAEVLAAEKVAKSKKLLKLTIKVGEETRTLVAGVAEHYDPADLVGRKVVIVANLMPATLMGIESNGMVLAASHEGTVSLLTLDKDVPSGSRVK